ncbi:MAG: hypothetical protein JJE16_08165 [Nitrospiraceae bacterium]|nr:hypothetical protein [Nitrospiraceae bacterium]
MNTLRGIIKRVLRREGRVGRTWLLNSETARSVNRLSSRTPSRCVPLQQRMRHPAVRLSD